ncbi:chitinase-3-like protein 1 [Dermacentor silvarum]|uniref:chitinase-3-like protein 1 n=1 Tax=Dermacentor silvarum TaxID=543639 RepID=UPI0021017F04|nr:chitinase-3-like protein 1 [Dermacentor silvarum]
MSAAQEVRAGAQGPLAPAPPPVLCCYYDPTWANETQRGDWAYDLREHFRDEHCSHAVFVGAQYRERAIELPDYAAAALEQFLLLRRRGLSLLASVFVVDASWAAQESGHFASTAAAWLRRHGFQGLELDVGRNAVSTGYDALVMALSKELRAHLPLLILSVNVYPEPSFMKHVNVKQIHDDADILVLNTQDLVNDDQVTAAHSALYGKHSWNSSLAAVYALTGSLSQLVPVVSFTSREFELQEPLPGPTSVSAGLGCQGPADLTPYHFAAGHRAFFEVCQIIDDPSWSNVWQADDYCYMQAKGKRFVVLEERESVTCKVKFAAAHRLLGVALKRMDADAFRSSPECGPALPLLNTVVREMHRLQPRPHGELHQWTHAERRLTVVRANGKMACLSHAH